MDIKAAEHLSPETVREFRVFLETFNNYLGFDYVI
jgi:hypothetical protein